VGELDPQRAAELLDRGLAHRVAGLQGAVDEGIDGGDHEHVAALLDHVGKRLADGVDDALKVDVEDPVEGLWIDRDQRANRLGDTGVGNDDVEPPELGYRRLDRELDRSLVSNVGGDRECARAD
jgi:hypothetical protein